MSNDELPAVDAVSSLEELLDLYGQPRATSLSKETDHVTDEYRAIIEASPFMTVATVGEGGVDCSPRGDEDHVAEVVSPRLLRFPDRRGNNRLDTLRNLVVDPRVALLFMVPGISETMRVVGRAVIRREVSLLEEFSIDGRAPVTVIDVHVDRVYFQCSRSVLRSQLWDPARHRDRASLPSCGQMLARLGPDGFDADAYDADLAERLAEPGSLS